MEQDVWTWMEHSRMISFSSCSWVHHCDSAIVTNGFFLLFPFFFLRLLFSFFLSFFSLVFFTSFVHIYINVLYGVILGCYKWTTLRWIYAALPYNLEHPYEYVPTLFVECTSIEFRIFKNIVKMSYQNLLHVCRRTSTQNDNGKRNLQVHCTAVQYILKKISRSIVIRSDSSI